MYHCTIRCFGNVSAAGVRQGGGWWCGAASRRVHGPSGVNKWPWTNGCFASDRRVSHGRSSTRGDRWAQRRGGDKDGDETETETETEMETEMETETEICSVTRVKRK